MNQQAASIDSLMIHADTALILSQRLGELCGHGPVLEQDIAMTNIALDYIGRSRLFYQLISTMDNQNKSEDDYAFLRLESEFRNFLLVEYPNTDFAYTVARQFFVDVYYYLFFEKCLTTQNKDLQAIADKSLKETAYHRKWSSEWIIRLGDGTDTSHQKIQDAVDGLWMYVGEMFQPSNSESAATIESYYPDVSKIKENWHQAVQSIFDQAGLIKPQNDWSMTGGKTGKHTEYMGYILAELQYMQRAYPNMQW